MNRQTIRSWIKDRSGAAARFGAATLSVAAALFVANFYADVLRLSAPKDYLAAVILPRRPETSVGALYGVLAASVSVPILGRYFHELDARKRDGSAKPLSGTILTTFFVTILVSVLVRLAYHISYRTMTPPVQPLEILSAPLLASTLYAILRIAFWTGGESHIDELRRGIRVIFSPREAARTFARESRRRQATGVKLHPSLTLPLDTERQHILLFGAPGAGKTQVMLPLLGEIAQRQDPVLLYDYKGDYTGLFGEDEKTLVLSPFDARGVRWDIAADVDTELKAAEFAAGLIPVGNSKEPAFPKAAQDLLVGVLCRLQAEKPKNWTIQDLVLLLGNKTEIMQSCERYRPAALNNLGDLKDRQTAGIMMSLRTGTIELEYLAKAWRQTERKISLADWATNQRLQTNHRMIIIRGNQQYKALSGFLTTQLFSLFAKKMLSLPDSRERRVWAVLDEFGNLPRIEGVEELLTAVRSKGLRVVAAIQDIAQIEVAYSPAFAQTFFNCFGTVLAGLNSGRTAKWLSDNFGHNQVEREIQGESTSKRSGAGDGKTRSTQHQVVVEPALLDTDFSNLTAPSRTAPAHFWTKIGGWPLAKLAFKVVPRSPAYPVDVVPDWVTAPPEVAPELTQHSGEVSVPLPGRPEGRKGRRVRDPDDDLTLDAES